MPSTAGTELLANHLLREHSNKHISAYGGDIRMDCNVGLQSGVSIHAMHRRFSS